MQAENREKYSPALRSDWEDDAAVNGKAYSFEAALVHFSKAGVYTGHAFIAAAIERYEANVCLVGVANQSTHFDICLLSCF